MQRRDPYDLDDEGGGQSEWGERECEKVGCGEKGEENHGEGGQKGCRIRRSVHISKNKKAPRTPFGLLVAVALVSCTLALLRSQLPNGSTALWASRLPGFHALQ